MSENITCRCASGCCGGGEVLTPFDEKAGWAIGKLQTPKGSIPVISPVIGWKDRLGGWKVRWGIGRLNYKISPGLYAMGTPDQSAPVLVSANYKLTFDALRKELSGLSCWIVILDTRGINVWCAAGKGTFGTEELVQRVEQVGLSDLVSHRTLILPQLGAPGVSAHEVAKRTGFSVVYGPVRARDVKAFIDAGFKATKEMRRVKFPTWERLALTPVELMAAAKKSLMVFGGLFLLNLFAAKPFALADFMAYIGAVVTGTVLTPLLLPLVPGRAFSFKGWLLGLCWTAGFAWQRGWFGSDPLLAAGYLMALPALSAYLAMNFTGSSTYTSFSGVTKEMKTALPLIIILSLIGLVLVLIRHLWA